MASTSRLAATCGGLVAGGLIAAALPALGPAAAAAPLVPVSPTAQQVPSASAISAPASYPYQEDLPVYDRNDDDASIARGTIRYDEIAPFLNDLMAGTNRLSAQVVGESTLGRDIYLVTVTAPENEAKTAQQAAWRDEIRNDPEAAADDAVLRSGYKTPIWFNGNIHGNEWEGTDSTLNVIENLVDAPFRGPDGVGDLLRENRLYFTVVNNPDGRALGQRATGLGLDPNRDFITNVTPETTIIRDLTHLIQPVSFTDIHGYTSVLQVEPCGPPHGDNYEYDLFIPHAYASALQIEQDVVAAEIPNNTYLQPDGSISRENSGRIKIPYRDTPSGWDDFPPIFTAQYVAFQGAITSTVELPLGRGSQPADLTMPQRAALNIEVSDIVVDSTIRYVRDNAAELVENQIETFRRGDAGEELRPLTVGQDPTTVPGPDQWAQEWDEVDAGYTAEFPRAYVVPVGADQHSQTAVVELVDHLIAHGVEVRRTTSDLEVDGTTHPAGSYLVDMHQPLRGLANSLLSPGSDISDRVPTMYDISAWSIGELWGADVVEVGDTLDPAPDVDSAPVTAATPTGEMPRRRGLLAMDLTGVAEVQAVNDLLSEDVAVTSVSDGRVVVGRKAYAAAAAAVDEFGVTFERVGRSVIDDDAQALDTLSIAYNGGADDRLSLLEMGFDDPLGFSASTLEAGDLADVDVLYLGSSLDVDPATQPGADAELRAFLDAGNGVVGRGPAAGFATTYDLVDAKVVAGSGSANGIVDVDDVPGSVLSTSAEDRAFVTGPYFFTGLSRDTTVEQRYAQGNPLVAGHWLPSGDGGNGPTDAGGQPSVISGESDSGARALLFGTSPTYRVHTRGMFDDVARGLFWAGPR